MVWAKGDRRLELALGFSHPVVVDSPEGVSFTVPAPTRITVAGNDKQAVGQVAAALMDNVGEIIEEPTIEQVDLIAAKLPR